MATPTSIEEYNALVAAAKQAGDSAELGRLMKILPQLRESKDNATEESEDEFCCPICDMEEADGAVFLDLGCGHIYCETCWRAHLVARVEDGEAERIRCMFHAGALSKQQCEEVVPAEIGTRLLADSGDALTLYLFRLRAREDSAPFTTLSTVRPVSGLIQHFTPSSVGGDKDAVTRCAMACECDYYHYNVGEQDKPWGCGFRVLQCVLSAQQLSSPPTDTATATATATTTAIATATAAASAATTTAAASENKQEGGKGSEPTAGAEVPGATAGAAEVSEVCEVFGKGVPGIDDIRRWLVGKGYLPQRSIGSRMWLCGALPEPGESERPAEEPTNTEYFLKGAAGIQSSRGVLLQADPQPALRDLWRHFQCSGDGNGSGDGSGDSSGSSGGGGCPVIIDNDLMAFNVAGIREIKVPSADGTAAAAAAAAAAGGAAPQATATETQVLRFDPHAYVALSREEFVAGVNLGSRSPAQWMRWDEAFYGPRNWDIVYPLL